MTYELKAANKRASLIFFLLNFINFLVFYIFEYLLESDALGYISSYFSTFVGSLFPILAVSFSIFTYTSRSFGRAASKMIIFVLYRLIYLLLYYYIFYIEAGYDTTDSIILSLLHSFIILLLTYGECIILLWVCVFITKKVSRGASDAFISGLSASSPFDLSVPLTLGIFAAAAVRFVTNLTVEIVNTVIFIIDFSGSIRLGEVFYIVFSFIFVLLILLASQFISVKLKVHLFSYARIEEENS